MKLTKERKILAAFMLVGLVALTFDRLTGRGATAPADADAAVASDENHHQASTPVVQAVAHPPVPTAMPGPAHNPATSPASLGQRIAQLCKADATAIHRPAAEPRDPFRVSPRWAAAAVTPVAKGEPAQPRPFEHTHHLTAVVVAGRQSCAVIDGALVRLRQGVAGYRLVAVTQDLAVLERGEARVTLKLEAGSSATVPASTAR